MPAFTAVNGGFRVAPGRYALVGENWSGSLPDPRPTADRHDELHVAGSDVPVIGMVDGMELLVLPIGADERGSRGRSLAVGTRSIVAFGRIAFVALDVLDLQSRHYPYASHIDEVVVLDFPKGGSITPVEGGIDLGGCNDGEPIFTIDTAAPGAFSIDGVFVDMADDASAEAFGYGTPEFNTGLDEHGVFLDLVDIRDRLRVRTDNAGIALMAKLAGMGPFKTAYYAPVAA